MSKVRSDKEIIDWIADSGIIDGNFILDGDEDNPISIEQYSLAEGIPIINAFRTVISKVIDFEDSEDPESES